MSTKHSYWQLIKANRIEIPVIQREYAQGRDEDRIKALRKAFVSDITNSIIKNTEPLHLGFIYGKVEGKDKYQERLRNKRAIENILNAVEGYAHYLDMRIDTKIESDIDSYSDSSNLPTFIPLDGQQRLTTLFLVHWYLSLFSTHNKQEITDTLSHFTYKTRKSSFEFCRAITQIDVHTDIENIGNERISQFIQKRKWFRRNWMNDSTVKGMLTMLDEIQAQFNIEDDKSLLFDKLSNKTVPIYFDFLDLNELNQTDELYVKMNARGKQLSEFEHFKAWLINHVKDNNIAIEEQGWKTKLDKEWLDLFWKNKGDSYSIDSTIYNFIKQVALFAYIQSKENGIDLDFTVTVRESEFIPFSSYEKFNFFNSETLNFVFHTLNSLCDEDLMSKYKDWLSDIACYPFIKRDENIQTVFLSNAKTVERTFSVFYYSLLLYNKQQVVRNNEHNFKTWMRLSRNLIYNTYIQTPENYVDAINGVYELFSNLNLETRAANLSGKKVRFLGSTLINEELKKLSIISSSSTSNWKELIIKFENHVYFRGDIRIIFEFSQIENGTSLEKFEFYGNHLYELFNDKIRSSKEVILQRALLTKGVYMPKVGSNYLFCLPNSDTLRARRDNWQKVFSDERKKLYLKQLIDENLRDAQDVETELRNAIKSYSENDWRKYLIKSSLPIRFCDNGYVRLQGTISAFESKIKVILLRTSKLYGRHAELRSYYHFETSIKKLATILPFSEVTYYENPMNRNTYPCIWFSNWYFDGLNYGMELTYNDENKYQFNVLAEEGKEELNQKIINCCIGMNWKVNNNNTKCSTQMDDDSQLTQTITSILAALNDIA